MNSSLFLMLIQATEVGENRWERLDRSNLFVPELTFCFCQTENLEWKSIFLSKNNETIKGARHIIFCSIDGRSEQNTSAI